MTRDKALETMDKLTEYGYTCRVLAWVDRVHVVPAEPGDTHYRVELAELSVDGIDLAHLVQVADELDLDVGLHSLSQGNISFGERDKTPPAIASPRRHPVKRQTARRAPQ